MSEEAIQRNLRLTGRTREELERDLAEIDAQPESERDAVLKNTNPEQEKKFTMPLGAEFP